MRLSDSILCACMCAGRNVRFDPSEPSAFLFWPLSRQSLLRLRTRKGCRAAAKSAHLQIVVDHGGRVFGGGSCLLDTLKNRLQCLISLQA
jgi:hypothetical protein